MFQKNEICLKIIKEADVMPCVRKAEDLKRQKSTWSELRTQKLNRQTVKQSYALLTKRKQKMRS
jgi:hypothetical protein